MSRQFEAWTPVSKRPVRTFNSRALAEAYAEDFAKLGSPKEPAVIIIKTARLERRTS